MDGAIWGGAKLGHKWDRRENCENGGNSGRIASRRNPWCERSGTDLYAHVAPVDAGGMAQRRGAGIPLASHKFAVIDDADIGVLIDQIMLAEQLANIEGVSKSRAAIILYADCPIDAQHIILVHKVNHFRLSFDRGDRGIDIRLLKSRS